MIFTKLKYLFCFLTAFFALGTCVKIACAQDIPGSVDPTKIQNQIPNYQSPRDSDLGNLVPLSSDIKLETPPEPLDGFILTALEIEGGTVFTSEELKEIYQNFLSKKADFATIKYIADKITMRYHEKGFFLSRALIPEQDIEGGRVKIVIVEGYISEISVQGVDSAALLQKDYFKLMGAATNSIKMMRPLHAGKLEEILLLLSDLPGVRVKALIEPLPPERALPGAAGMVLNLERRNFDAALAFDNSGSRFAGPFMATANAAVYNVISAYDTVSLSAAGSLPLSEVKVLKAGYTIPVSLHGTTLGMQAGYSDLVPGHTLKQFDVKSDSKNFSFNLTQNFIRSRERNFSASIVFDAVNTKTDYLGEELYDDRIRSLRISGQFDTIDRLNGVSFANVTLSQGLDILGARETGSTNLSRQTGHSDYKKIEVDLNRIQQINQDWQLYGALSGQYAWDPLLSSEEFGYGGQSLGRGYDPSEITGDHGISASLELRYQGMPAYKEVNYEPFLFYDIGKVWKPDAAKADQIVSGASAGAGLKFNYNDRFSGDFTAAAPLTLPASDPPGYTKDNGVRFLLRINWKF